MSSLEYINKTLCDCVDKKNCLIEQVYFVINMDVFFRERELCELFKSENSNENQKVVYTIEANAVTISIFHKGSLDYKRMCVILYVLWDNFKLPIIAWKETCSLFRYKNFMKKINFLL